MPNDFFQPGGGQATLVYPGDTDVVLNQHTTSWLAEHPVIAERLFALRNSVDRRNAQTAADNNAIAQLTEAVQDATAKRSQRQAAYRDAYQEMPEDEASLLDLEVKAAKQAQQEAFAQSQTRIRAKAGDQAALDVCVKYINTIAGAVTDIEFVEVAALPGNHLDNVQKLQAEERAEWAAVAGEESGEPPEDVVLATSIKLLDKLIAPASEAISVSFSPKGPKVHLARRALPVETPGGEMVTVPDITALVLAANRDILVKQITAQVRAHYAKNPLVRTEVEKPARIAAIIGRIRERQRVECACVWAAREQGIDIPFRAGLDPEAILGLTGGPKLKIRLGWKDGVFT